MQPPPPGPVVRADVSGVLGWLAVHKEVPAGYDFGDDWQHTALAGVAGGWYWTDHHKTEIELGASTEARSYRSRRIVVNGRLTSEFVESRYSQRVFSIGQQYQFFRNAWFHPYVGAGAAGTFERVTDRADPILVFDDVPGAGRVIRPERTVGPRTDVTVAPFVATGFKAYLTPRGFFRSDLRISMRGGVENVLVRFGFGVDFGR